MAGLKADRKTRKAERQAVARINAANEEYRKQTDEIPYLYWPDKHWMQDVDYTAYDPYGARRPSDETLMLRRTHCWGRQMTFEDRLLKAIFGK
jgi:hypothetical protein